MLCLFTVARREKIGQLCMVDIREQDGIAFFEITDGGQDQTLKNAGCKRRIPMHPASTRRGFFNYVDQMRSAREERLFPQSKKGSNGFSDAVGKFFSRLVTKCGLGDDALVLHGLRHGGITKLHAAGVADDVVKMRVGHSDQSVHGSTYVHRHLIPLKLLKEGIERLRYDEVVDALQQRRET